MPWRETRDPYRIWVSEIMLQQTRVETVIPYYERFVSRFPDVASLSRAPIDRVMKAWEGLATLPGVGRSTAGAIAAIAYGADVPILDANARRVVARLFAVSGDPRTAKIQSVLWEMSARIVAKGKGRETALAVMDLGAAVCLPKDPRCGVCPVATFCAAYLAGRQGEIPLRTPLNGVPHHDVVAALFLRPDGCLFLRRRPPSRLLGGLWAFPSGRRGPGETLERALHRAVREKLHVRAVIQRKVGTVSHSFSHYRITLHGYLCKAANGALPAGKGSGWLAPPGRGRYAMPRADGKLVELVRREGKR